MFWVGFRHFIFSAALTKKDLLNIFKIVEATINTMVRYLESRGSGYKKLESLVRY